MPFKNKEDKLNYMKKYRIDNNDKIIEYGKNYYILKKEKYKCICGQELIILNKTRHEKTLKHLNFISPNQK